MKPITHISATMIDLWRNDLPAFYARYFRGEEPPTTPALALGRRLAKLMEALQKSDGEMPEGVTDAEAGVIGQLTTLDMAEYRVDIDIAPDVRGVAYFDTADDLLTTVIDYKTGATPWTPERLEQSTQMKFYSLLIWKAFGRTPVVGIDWAETTSSGGGAIVEFTGRVEKFRHQFTAEEMKEFQAEVIGVWEDIERHAAAFTGTLPSFSTDVLDRYIAAREELERAKKEEDEARRAYVAMFEENGIRRFETEAGTFSTYTRTTYDYPAWVKEREAALKEAKSRAEESGEAVAVESTVYQFRAAKKNPA